MSLSGNHRENIKIGIFVGVVLKKNQRTGEITSGHVKKILTNSAYHPHGIKVMLEEEDLVGRVQIIMIKREYRVRGNRNYFGGYYKN